MIGGTSTTSASFTFTETSANSFSTTGGSFTRTLLDSSGNQTIHLIGTPTISAPGSLDASVIVNDNSFTVSWTSSDTANIETIIVGGLHITADANAALGPIIMAGPNGCEIASPGSVIKMPAICYSARPTVYFGERVQSPGGLYLNGQ
jgi:hypothetical protein